VPEPSAPRRIPLVDLLRGLAFVAMVVYHFSWFATDAGLLELPIRSSLGWVAFQKCIAGTFFGLVGVSLHLSGARGRGFWRRMGKLAGCALVVTATSLVLDPRRLVSFGILHCIAVSSLLVRPLLGRSTGDLVGLGTVLVALGIGVSHPFFDHAALQWTGLSTRLSATFDIQPLLPWLGVVVLGVGAGRWLQRSSLAGAPVDGGPARLLRLAGRHSLLLYMAHVPVLVGIVAAWKWLS